MIIYPSFKIHFLFILYLKKYSHLFILFLFSIFYCHSHYVVPFGRRHFHVINILSSPSISLIFIIEL